MSGHVFVSYSRVDRPYVERLAAHLNAAGIPAWYDYEMDVGTRFASVIQRQIDTCAAFVVVLTPTSVASEWVFRELSYSLNKRKPVLPLLLAPSEIPLLIIDRHHEDVSDGQMPNSRFMTTLHRLTQSSAYPNTAAAGAPLDVPTPSTGPARITGELLHTLTGHTDMVVGVAYSPDGHHVATISGDKIVRIWDIATGQTLHTLTGHTSGVWGVAYSPDGHHLATTSGDKTARIWDTTTGQTLHTLTGHTNWVWGG